MELAAVLLGLAALGGLTNISLRFRGGNPPLLLAGAHGLVAAAGLVTLAVSVLTTQAGGMALLALILLVSAALLGFYVLSFHLRGRLIPLGFALFHGFLAVLGYTILLSHLYRS
jgi:hypothetical protein